MTASLRCGSRGVVDVAFVCVLPGVGLRRFVLLFLTVDEMGLLFFPMCGGIKLPSLVFVGTGTDAGFSDGFLGTYKIGLFFPSSPGWSVGWRAGGVGG
jgi:hypothetical protein